MLANFPSGSQKTGSSERGRPRSKGSWAGSWVGLMGPVFSLCKWGGWVGPSLAVKCERFLYQDEGTSQSYF